MTEAVLKDAVLETSSTTGTGTLALNGSPTGYFTFSDTIGNGNVTHYSIRGKSATGTLTGEREVGEGTVSAGQLSRDRVFSSSNGGSLVDFTSFELEVFCDIAALVALPVISDSEPPINFEGQFWYDTDATGSSVLSTEPITTKTANYPATADDVIILCDGTFTVTLPTAVGISGKTYRIKNIGTGIITVATTSGQTIDNLTSFTLTGLESIEPCSDNANWWVL